MQFHSRALIAFAVASFCSCAACAQDTISSVSGLAWISPGICITVHDFKNPAANGKPRVGLIEIPATGDRFRLEPLELQWPAPLGESSDLESVSHIPGTDLLLLCESGQESGFRRIFLVEFRDRKLKLISFTEWPVAVKNVEATAVAKVGDRLVFIYAERAGGHSSTAIRWAEFQYCPLKFGEFQDVVFNCPDPVGPAVRAVVAIEMDQANGILVSSVTDPGDDGPFRSVIWHIGKILQSEKTGQQSFSTRNPSGLLH